MASTAPASLDNKKKFAGRMARLLHTDKDPRSPWLEDDPLRNPFGFAACHWGQLKLLYGEIEFLTLAAASHDLANCTVVYVGAAPGHSIGLLRRMFPTLRFLLVDPAKFVAKQDSHVHILNTLFTDDTAAAIVRDMSKTRTLLFISDIRLTVDDADGFESAVFADMLAQQRWCVGLGAAMGMLKFRMPFADAKTGPRDMRYDYRELSSGQGKLKPVTLKKGVPKDPSAVAPGSMVYLDGELRFQLYPPPDSAETRLIVRRAPATGKYPLKLYDYDAYEQTMSHFNTVTRRARYAFPHAAILARNIAGFDAGSYECACEALIASEYLRVVVPTAVDLPRAVTRVVFAIHRDMWEVTKRSVISCKLETPLATSKETGIRRVVERLLRRSADAGSKRREMHESMDRMARQSTLRAEAQIKEFTALSSETHQSLVLVLRRIDYLSQVSWLRSEIAEIRRLHDVYSGILAGRQAR